MSRIRIGHQRASRQYFDGGVGNRRAGRTICVHRAGHASRDVLRHRVNNWFEDESVPGAVATRHEAAPDVEIERHH